MSSVSVYVHYNRLMKGELLLSLEKNGGFILEISDILNIVVYRTNYSNLNNIKALNGVTSITDKEGNRIEG